MITLLGLHFGSCFLVIKAIWIATAIPAKSFHCEVKWWRHTEFCNHEWYGRHVKLRCFSVCLWAYYTTKLVQLVNETASRPFMHSFSRYVDGFYSTFRLPMIINNGDLPFVQLSTPEVAINSNQVAGMRLARGRRQIYMVDCKMRCTVEACGAMPRPCMEESGASTTSLLVCSYKN